MRTNIQTLVWLLVGYHLAVDSGEFIPKCRDLDTQACTLFHSARPTLCSDPSFSQGPCVRFCGNCPLECFSCPTPVRNPFDCNTTAACSNTSTCMTKHLVSQNGHEEFIMICEKKDICEGLTLGFPFGKRALLNEDSVHESDELGRGERDVTLSCCDTDFCNAPVPTISPTTPGPFPYGCIRDIVFVVDDSGSVGLYNFKTSMNFITSIVNQLDVGPTMARIALLLYSTTFETGWPFTKYTNKTQVLNAISKVAYAGGLTHTAEALRLVRVQILNSTRADVKSVVLVLTDGNSNDRSLTIREAQELHHFTNNVITIVVGTDIDRMELNAIATDSHHIFDVRNYAMLSTILPQVLQLVCNA